MVRAAGAAGEEERMSQSGSQMALRRWELENGIDQTDEDINGEVNGATGGGRARDGAAAAAGSAGASSSSDALFVYSQEEQSAVQRQRAWTSDPEYFTHVRTSPSYFHLNFLRGAAPRSAAHRRSV